MDILHSPLKGAGGLNNWFSKRIKTFNYENIKGCDIYILNRIGLR